MALFAQSFWAAVLGSGVLAGAGMVIGGALPVQTSTMRWFVRRRALAFAIVLSAGGIGGVFAPPVLNFVISEAGDWRAGWWVFAAFAALSAVVAFLFARSSHRTWGSSQMGTSRRTKHLHRSPRPCPPDACRHLLLQQARARRALNRRGREFTRPPRPGR